MAEYGITDKGFVLKRMDSIMEELHSDLSKGFGFDTRLNQDSFLNVLITSFAGKIADVWEEAQNSYYAKYPSTALGVNLDNAVQYGGIRRAKSKKTYYPIHCTGVDGTKVRKGVQIGTTTSPQITLSSPTEFNISRSNCNSIVIKVVYIEPSEYFVVINGEKISYISEDAQAVNILHNLAELVVSVTENQIQAFIDTENEVLILKDSVSSRSNNIELSENLTTDKVTTIAAFATDNYGKVYIPQGLATEIITVVSGFISCTNIVSPTYGRLTETDVELRHSYIAKSAIRSSRMIDSITSRILDVVDGVESADGFENDSNSIDADGRPPHSVEIIVDGGDETKIAQIILEEKAGGIQTYGKIEIPVVTWRNDVIPIRFNRPEYLYVWLRVVLHGEQTIIPANYKNLAVQSILNDINGYVTGTPLLSQKLNDQLYKNIAGLTYIDIKAFSTQDKDYVPAKDEYVNVNISVTSRQKILAAANRIEVDIA